MMRARRTILPTAAPIYLRNIVDGSRGIFNAQYELKRFEGELKAYFGVKYCTLLSSGKAALKAILMALQRSFPERYEVIIPAFTCYSVPSAIVAAGMKVIPCEIQANSFDMDEDILSSLISPKTLAIVPCHIFGMPAGVGRLRSIVKDERITIVEDAAQAMGAKIAGEYLGTIGDVGFFSLGRGKAITTVEGGIILTSRADIQSSLEEITERTIGYGLPGQCALLLKAIALKIFSRPNLFWFPRLLPFLHLGETIYDPHFEMRKMSGFQAGFSRNWEENLGRFRSLREKNSREFIQELSGKGMTFFLSCSNGDRAYLRLPFVFHDVKLRTRVLYESERRGLGIMASYPDAINSIPQLKNRFENSMAPMAHKTSQSLLTLPIHPLLKTSDKQAIVDFLMQKI